MGKLNPGSIARKQRVEREFTLSYGELEDKIKLKSLGTAASLAAKDIADRLTTEYVTGVGEPGQAGYIPPVPLPPVDGQPSYGSSNAFYLASLVHYAQVCDNEADRYDPVDLVVMMNDDDFMKQVIEMTHWVTSQSEKTEKPEGN